MLCEKMNDGKIMKKIAIISLLIALTSCVTPKKDYSKEQPVPRIEETTEEIAEREAEDKLFARIDKLRKLGVLDGDKNKFYRDPMQQLRNDIMIILMSDKCGKIKNNKASLKCSERVFNEIGGIDYIEGRL